MFVKIVFLFSISAVLASGLQDTAEALKEFFQDIDTQVKALEHETMIQLRTNVIPLETSIENAKLGIVQNLTDAAVPYWATIRSLQETAKAEGKDITACVELGNNQIYTLNNSISEPAYAAYDYYNQTGNEILNASLSEAYSVIQELIPLEELVAHCNSDVCATDLMKIVTQYYARAKQTLIDAETKTRNYVQVYLPSLLAFYNVDSDSYVQQYTVFLNDVNNCISKL